LRPFSRDVEKIQYNILRWTILIFYNSNFKFFHEGFRLKLCLKMHKRLFDVEVKMVGGETGYVGTENRDYCKENGIQISFVKCGCPFNEEKKV